MLELITDKIENYLKGLEISSGYGAIDDVQPYDKLKKLEGVTYGLAYKLDSGTPYKERKGKFDDLLFVYGFAPNSRAAYFLKRKITEHLDKARLTDSNFRVYACKYRSLKGAPTLNESLQMYEIVMSFDIRWERVA